MTALEMGTLPAWLALLGALVALTTYVSGRLDARRRAASMVHVIVISYSHSYPDGPDHHTLVQIDNNSDLPVFDCAVELYDWGKRRLTWRFRVLDEWFTGRRVAGRITTSVRAHDRSSEVRFPGLGGATSADGLPNLGYMPTNVVLIFRDGAGRSWVRWPDGRLSRLRPSRSLNKLPRAVRRSRRASS